MREQGKKKLKIYELRIFHGFDMSLNIKQINFINLYSLPHYNKVICFNNATSADKWIKEEKYQHFFICKTLWILNWLNPQDYKGA